MKIYAGYNTIPVLIISFLVMTLPDWNFDAAAALTLTSPANWTHRNTALSGGCITAKKVALILSIHVGILRHMK